MENTNDCTIKIIFNTQATKSFNLRFQLYPKKMTNLKIVITRIEDIYSIIEEIKNQIILKNNFNIQWNWKNTPAVLKEDKKMQEELSKIFRSSFKIEPVKPVIGFNIKGIASLVKSHINNYGANPDFNDLITEKNKNKIFNYIKTVTSMHKLTMEQAMDIAKLVNE